MQNGFRKASMSSAFPRAAEARMQIEHYRLSLFHSNCWEIRVMSSVVRTTAWSEGHAD